MRYLSYFFIVFVFFFSCSKEKVAPANNDGLLGTYLSQNPKINIVKTTQSKVVYDPTAQTDRGYMFSPLKSLTMTAIGGRIALKGKFSFQLFHLQPDQNYVDISFVNGLGSLIFSDSVVIDDITKFVYKEINPITLQSGEKYLLRYFNKSHESVYDAGLGYGQTDASNIIKFPLIIDKVQVMATYYTYKGPYGETEGEFDLGILRGLVDFKYK